MSEKWKSVEDTADWLAAMSHLFSQGVERLILPDDPAKKRGSLSNKTSKT